MQSLSLGSVPIYTEGYDGERRLGAESEGLFAAGWKVEKPTRISYLKSLAKEGDMLVAYGTPYRMRSGVIQLNTSSVRPISADDYSIVGAEPEAALQDAPAAAPAE